MIDDVVTLDDVVYEAGIPNVSGVPDVVAALQVPGGAVGVVVEERVDFDVSLRECGQPLDEV
jgi:hypothetical protein